ncbi:MULTISPECIES: cytosine permease [unclassified Crossiella]|uniref:purine-cytosine permease family protein n=1 Tax=unclassified Crossiella TaxID=2620835 RepID=UPI001FFEA82B|nr:MULTISPECIES: cytosine permease [unclassified Crossiella]MCK2243485.1 cytosine permease [Crossiella sp. S99.2]MCK2257343.1 cytosine permease [Crossiella sp. S99.1]
MADDYTLRRVPPAARHGWRTVAVQSFGQAGNIGLLMLGALLGLSLGFWPAAGVLVLGLAIQTAALLAMGIMGMREGLATTVLTRWTGLGRYGSAILGLVLACCVTGWFGVLNTVVAQGFHTIVGGPRWIWALATGAAITVIVMFGFTVMARTAAVTAPAFLALAGYLALTQLWDRPLAEPTGALSVPAGVTAVVGVWIIGIVVAPDITRFTRDRADVVRLTLFGTVLGQLLIGLCGIALALAFHTTDVVTIVTAGSGFLGIAVLITATANIQNLNLYVGTLSLANALDTLFGRRPSPRLLTLGMGLLGAIASATGLLSTVEGLLAVLAGVLPPVVGIATAEYYLVRRWRPLLEHSRPSDNLPRHAPAWLPGALLIWLATAAIGLLVPWGIPALNALLSAFGLTVLAGWFSRRRSPRWSGPRRVEETPR